ncbi:TIGR02757 family protein [Leptospira fainei serovar Hurstbridge str. BUT 6]|uniref:TIGR02757 family protein n=1 Tax=Leptospira fainei serovar Hurstbridge str. BUT 6 TaxID=1193011 RepID=S3UZ78_9LEPT|nr:TIGR02757 family protein [Leptospira fainei]EPG73659.1 TIGR02757 family protein [Leptospira fainei serovar Hurstbridge str. BUT 6]
MVAESRLRRDFQKLYEAYTRPEFLDSDPLFLCYLYESPEDREFVGILSALFAYGNVASIRGFLSRLLTPMGDKPKSYLLSEGTRVWKGKLGPYRFQKESDILLFLEGLRIAYGETKRTGSSYLEPWFSPTEGTDSKLEKRIAGFQYRLSEVLSGITRKWSTYGLNFLIGSGKENSAYKRYCMYLRWMVRREAPDLGLYKTILPDELVFPLDTHINRLAEILGASSRKTSDFKKSREITNFFLKLYPDDPLRMDFSLSRLGILRKCKTKYIPDLCETCEVKSLCRIYAAK